MMNCRRSMETNANKVIREVNLILHKLQVVKNHMNEKTRRIVATANILSKIQYGLPQYVKAKQKTKNNLQTCIMKIVRFVKNDQCARISNSKLCKSLNWDIPSQMILKKSMIFTHKMILTMKPKKLISLIRFPKLRRNPKFTLKYNPKTEKFKRNMIYESLRIYNELPQDMKKMSMKQFKKAMKNHYILVT